MRDEQMKVIKKNQQIINTFQADIEENRCQKEEIAANLRDCDRRLRLLVLVILTQSSVLGMLKLRTVL